MALTTLSRNLSAPFLFVDAFVHFVLVVSRTTLAIHVQLVLAFQ
jgi:hypothetical protein